MDVRLLLETPPSTPICHLPSGHPYGMVIEGAPQHVLHHSRVSHTLRGGEAGVLTLLNPTCESRCSDLVDLAMSSLPEQHRLYDRSIYPPMGVLHTAAVPEPAGSTPRKHGMVPARRSAEVDGISDVLLEQDSKSYNPPADGVTVSQMRSA